MLKFCAAGYRALLRQSKKNKSIKNKPQQNKIPSPAQHDTSCRTPCLNCLYSKSNKAKQCPPRKKSSGREVISAHLIELLTRLNSGIYTRGRLAAVALGISRLKAGIATHRFATRNPDYEICKDLANGRLIVSFKK